LSGLFKWASRRDQPPPASAPVAAGVDTVATSKVLPRLLAALSNQPSPVLVDLGPVVGSNIAFFGERLSCKIHVEDLFQEVEAAAQRGALDTLAANLDRRLTHGADSVDGILCWDLFDFLDRPTGQALAARLSSMLRKGGVLYGFFGTSPAELTQYTRFVAEADDKLRLRPYPATPVKRTVLVTRDINRMFEGLVVAESVLLKSNTREALFRKP